MESLKILVIDDELGLREGCRRICEPEGYEVLTAENGRSGLDIAASNQIDCALIDLKLPDMDGLDVLKKIKENDPEIVPIIISGHGTIEVAVEAMKLGALDFVSKPFTPDELMDVVNKALREKIERQQGLEKTQEHRERAVDDLNSMTIVDEIMARYDYRDSALIAILQDIQKQFNYLPQNLLRYVALRINIPLPRVYSISTFYKAFSLKPRGRHLIDVCLGTACHVRGGMNIMERLERELGIKNGETTYDEKFSVKSVRCVGCCGLAPVIVIDDEFHGKLNQEQIPKILAKY